MSRTHAFAWDDAKSSRPRSSSTLLGPSTTALVQTLWCPCWYPPPFSVHHHTEEQAREIQCSRGQKCPCPACMPPTANDEEQDRRCTGQHERICTMWNQGTMAECIKACLVSSTENLKPHNRCEPVFVKCASCNGGSGAFGRAGMSLCLIRRHAAREEKEKGEEKWNGRPSNSPAKWQRATQGW